MKTPQTAGHLVTFYDADEHLVATAGEYLREGLDAGCTCIVVATPAHRAGIAGQLANSGLNPAALESRYQYIPLDAQAMLTNFMVEGQLDRRRFHETVGLLMRQAAARGQPVRIYGEMVAMLAAENSLEASLELEELWNELSRQQTFLLLCGYPNAVFNSDAKRAERRHICAVHSRVC